MATYQERKGRWRAIVRRNGSPTKSKTFPTKALAKTWAERMERELSLQTATGSRDLDAAPMSDLFAWYRTTVATEKRISATQAGNLTRLEEGLGPVPAGKLSAAHVVAHVQRRRRGEHMLKVGLKAPACGAATMTVELTYLSQVLKLATSLGVLSVRPDPVAEARPALRHLNLTGRSRKRDRRPTADELRQLDDYFRASMWRSKIPMHIVIEFAIATGRRESEITRLLNSDVDSATRTALLRDAKHPRNKQGNHKRFPLLGKAWDIVQDQVSRHRDERIFPYKSDSIGTAFTRACRNLGIVDLHFHDLRHEATSRLFEQGYSIEQVAAVTLHESWTELKRYTQLRPESLHREAADPRTDSIPDSDGFAEAA